MFSYRLPNGETTKDVETYCNSWRELGEAVCQLFPGYQLTSFNPGMCFDKFGTTEVDGRVVNPVLDSFKLSVEAAKVLIDRVDELLGKEKGA